MGGHQRAPRRAVIGAVSTPGFGLRSARSGELIVKNGKLRDDLAKQYGVLCFETEEARALADFPFIVI
jgi:hypothetical protein